jgi:hypothetical protein
MVLFRLSITGKNRLFSVILIFSAIIEHNILVLPLSKVSNCIKIKKATFLGHGNELNYLIFWGACFAY